MRKRSGIISILGFTLMALGFLSLLLGAVGLRFSFLAWMDAFGGLTGFIIKMSMVLSGFAFLYVANTDLQG